MHLRQPNSSTYYRVDCGALDHPSNLRNRGRAVERCHTKRRDCWFDSSILTLWRAAVLAEGADLKFTAIAVDISRQPSSLGQLDQDRFTRRDGVAHFGQHF